MVRGLELLVADRSLRDNRLDKAAPVADRQKMDLAARSPVMQPPADGDARSLVPGDVFDVRNHEKLPASSSELAARPSRRFLARAACSSVAAALCCDITSNMKTPSYLIFSNAMITAGQSIAP